LHPNRVTNKGGGVGIFKEAQKASEQKWQEELAEKTRQQDELAAQIKQFEINFKGLYDQLVSIMNEATAEVVSSGHTAEFRSEMAAPVRMSFSLALGLKKPDALLGSELSMHKYSLLITSDFKAQVEIETTPTPETIVRPPMMASDPNFINAAKISLYDFFVLALNNLRNN
jgi:hypothetical protein